MTSVKERGGSTTPVSREAYDRLWSQTWGDQQTFGPVHRRMRRVLLALIRELGPASVLDVGCGSGGNLAAIAQVMPNSVLSGVDVSPEALALAAERVPSARFRQLDAQKDKLDERFDLVLCNQVIEHLMDDTAALRNMTLMAKRWVLATSMRGRMRPSERAIGHLRNYSNGELRTKADKAGLEVVDIFGWGFPFYSPLYRTVVEWIPGGPPQGKIESGQRIFADLLYHLYGLNIPRRGDVVTLLARPKELSA